MSGDRDSVRAAGPVRRITFVITTLITLPVWLSVFAAVILTWIAVTGWYWIMTGSTEPPVFWADRFALMIERWVRSWLKTGC